MESLRKVIPAIMLTVALGITAVACSSSDGKDGFDTNMDTQFESPTAGQ
jgi:hypothetical protein